MKISSRSIPSSDVIVIGYGSLMSGLGLAPFGRLRARSGWRVTLLNAHRGFGKLSQHGDRFAMVLEPTERQPIEARILSADAPASGGPEGIALLVQPADLARICEREGYSSGAVQRLRQEAAAKRQELATFLWTMYSAARFDAAAYRQQLFKLVGYTSPHYIPHPVPLDANRFALTFLAPGREGSGSDRIIPVRVRTHNETLMTSLEAWQRKPTTAQLTYLAACLLAGVHGISILDILQPMAEDAGLCERVRAEIRSEQPQELGRFLEMSGLDHAAYWQTFGPPNQSVRRSRLEDFLKS